MPKRPRPLAAPTFALAVILAGTPLTGLAPKPVAAAVLAAYASSNREPVAPGVQLDQGRILTSAGSQAINIVEVDLSNPVITLESSLSNDRVADLERTSTQAQNRSYEGHRVVAAINGDVWAGFSNDMEDAPNGLHVEAGELVTSGTAGRPTFGVGPDGRPLIGSPLVAVTLTTSLAGQFVINRVNQLRRAGEVVLYTPRFGPRTSSAASGIDVILSGLALPLRASGAWIATVAGIRPAEGGGPIDPGSVILTAPATSPLAALVPGEQVTLTTAVSAGWESVLHAVGGREWIVRNGAVSISPRPASADELHPRSSIGVTADGRVIMATVDGRQSGWSRGMSLPDLASLMLSRGAVTALNLDGGGSTSIAVRRAGTSGPVLVNRPSDGSERAVTNSIQVVSHAPTGPLSALNVLPAAPSLYRNAAVDFTFSGMDWAYNPVPLMPGQATWAVSPPVGTIDANGHFAATEPGTAQVTVSANGIVGTAQVTVLADSAGPTASPPRATLPSGRSIGSGLPVTVAWDAATDSGSGVAGYELQRSIDGKAWTPVALATPLTRSVVLSHQRSHVYRYQVRATDKAGNAGPWAVAGAFKVWIAQESASSVNYVRGTWTKRTSSSFDLGATRSTASTGAIARFPFTGDSFAWVGARGPSRGAVRIYVDRAYVTTINTHSASTATKVLLWSRTWSSPGRHTIEFRAVGTSGHPRVDLDAFAYLNPVSASLPPPGTTPTPTPTPTPVPTPTPAATPTPGPSEVIVGAGDIASCGLTGDTATANLIKGIAGTVFTTGDNAYETGSTADFQNCYEPTWGAFKDRTYPTPGNHEYVTTGAADYFSYFGARAGPAGMGWYAYDLGAWRIYSLNSNCLVVGCDAGGAQEQWLREDLAANPRACVLAYWHHPRFSSGQHGNDSEVAPFWNALYEAGADVIVNGHDHGYERFAPQTPSAAANATTGIRQFVVGTGGASLRSFATTKANSQVRNSSTHGVMKLTLSAGSYGWQFIPTTGTFTDSGTGTCH